MNAPEQKEAAQHTAAKAELWWLAHAFGQQLLAWEQAQCDRAVGDIFGYHAVQLGLCERLDALRANRMPWRWRVGLAQTLEGDAANTQPRPQQADRLLGVWPQTAQLEHQNALICHACALPLACASVDLLVLPHVLDDCVSVDAALAEVTRVLVPEGRLLILGLNPVSLWALQHWLERAPVPNAAEGLSVASLRDRLQTLGFVVEDVRFGGHEPAAHSPQTLHRWHWLGAAGQRMWPMLGGAYCLQAVKRQATLRPITGAAWEANPSVARAPQVVASRHPVLKKKS